MSSSGNDSSYEEKIKFLNSEQDPSTCADREPSGPIAAECSRLMEPEFRKSKMVVTIEEKDDELKPPLNTKKLETGKKLKSTKQLQSLALNPGRSTDLSKVVNTTTPHTRQVGRYLLSTTFETLEDDEKPETPDERSTRLLFESKRKAHYFDEGITHKKSHMESSNSPLVLDYEFKTPPKSEDESPSKKLKKSKDTRKARSEKSKAPHRSEKSKARGSEKE